MANFCISAFACPRCRSPLEQLKPDELYCMADDQGYILQDGIWRMLLPEREEMFDRFINEYETIRRSEGRGLGNPQAYRSLPNLPPNLPMAKDWRIRSASYQTLLRQVIQPAQEQKDDCMSIVDLGAGNSWLSYRLSKLGHKLAAVDLLTNDFDGLGCSKYYQVEFSSVQAEFDRLPFDRRSADMVIFNASLHYSVDYSVTLREALRILDDAGTVIILDSPIYKNGSSGMQMVKQREAQFLRKYGFASNALASQNFLTYQALAQLGEALHVQWRYMTPNYGLRWKMRPWIAALSGSREPAKFHLIVGRKSHP